MPDKPSLPELSPAAAETWGEVRTYVEHWAARRPRRAIPDLLFSAASDVMSGYRLRNDPDAKELINKGLIERDGVSWYLTDMGMSILDPREPVDDGPGAQAAAAEQAEADARAWAWA